MQSGRTVSLLPVSLICAETTQTHLKARTRTQRKEVLFPRHLFGKTTQVGGLAVQSLPPPIPLSCGSLTSTHSLTHSTALSSRAQVSMGHQDCAVILTPIHKCSFIYSALLLDTSGHCRRNCRPCLSSLSSSISEECCLRMRTLSLSLSRHQRGNRDGTAGGRGRLTDSNGKGGWRKAHAHPLGPLARYCCSRSIGQAVAHLLLVLVELLLGISGGRRA